MSPQARGFLRPSRSGHFLEPDQEPLPLVLYEYDPLTLFPLTEPLKEIVPQEGLETVPVSESPEMLPEKEFDQAFAVQAPV